LNDRGTEKQSEKVPIWKGELLPLAVHHYVHLDLIIEATGRPDQSKEISKKKNNTN
jgi:hypothetical protein